MDENYRNVYKNVNKNRQSLLTANIVCGHQEVLIGSFSLPFWGDRWTSQEMDRDKEWDKKREEEERVPGVEA